MNSGCPLRRRAWRHALLSIVTLVIATACAFAADVPLEAGFTHLVGKWDQSLRHSENRLRTGALSANAVERLRAELDEVRAEAQTHGRIAQRKVDELRALRDALGPPPAADAPATDESAAIRLKREQLSGAIADLSGQVKQSDLVIARSETLLKQISAAEFERRTTNLLVRGPVPVKLQTWRDAGTQLLTVFQAIHAGDAAGRSKARFVVLPLVLLGTWIAIVVGRLMRERMQRRWGRDPSIPYPTYGKRLLAAVIDGVSRGLVPVLVIAIVLAAAWWSFVRPFLDPSIGAPAWLLYAIAFYLLVAAFIRAAFSPEQPNWRLAPVSALASETIGRRLNLLALVFAVQMAISQFLGRFGESAELASLHSFFINLLLAGLLLSMLHPRLWQAEEATEWYVEQPRRGVPAVSSYLRLFLGVVAIVTVGCNLFGYPALADYLLRTTILSMLLLGAVFALRLLARESFSRLLMASAGHATMVKTALGLTEQGGKTLSFWLLAAIDVLLIIAGVFIGLALWGIPARDVADGMLGIFGSFDIGTHRFSLTDVLLGALVFGAIIVITRLLQHFLEQRLLPNTRLDIGIRTAIASAVSYIGIGIAILAAISTLGVSLTGLAVVAGALSVGIGFGLQNIVNNFISGIILLIERPVKVGDAVVVKNYEGVVRRIRVRSTELETDLHASVIIPNADLLQTAVLNWTHRDRVARVEIRVPAPYNVEPERIEGLLLECARAHPQILRYPAPTVLLVNFTDHGAEYQLSFQLEDLDHSDRVSSDVRRSILATFRGNGIDIWAQRANAPPASAPIIQAASGVEVGQGAADAEPSSQVAHRRRP